MEDLKTKAKELAESLSEYAKTYYKLTVLKLADKTTGIIASVVALLAVLFLGTLGIIFLGIALGLWLGQLLDNPALGFLLTAAFFFLVMLLLVVLRKRLVFPIVRNKIINKLYEPDDKNLQ